MSHPVEPGDASEDFFRSVDSTPVGYASHEPSARVNGFYLAFAAVALLLLSTLALVSYTRWPFTARDLAFAHVPGQRTTIPARLFVLAFLVVFSLAVHSNLWRKAALVLQMVLGFLGICLVIDTLAFILDAQGVIRVEIYTQQILSVFAAMCLFPWLVCLHARLPPPGPPPKRPGRIRWHAWVRLVVPVVLAAVVAVQVERELIGLVTRMRSWALLGGVGPGLFLVQQLFALQTALIGLWLIYRSRHRRPGFAPDIGILVPAHNEAHGIHLTIEAVARAARHYPGAVRLYVIDNLSTDGTVVAAERALRNADGLTGRVLSCEQAGKAIALNYGFARAAEEFLVRIDADTVISETCLSITMRHFADPRVGVVGGMPLPDRRGSFFDRVRTVEVLLRHGFYQAGLVGIDGIVGVPGMFVAYRAAALHRAGPLAQGINGEDTDISLRISLNGYLAIVDPFAIYYSETPHTWAHLREQRNRWFRSIYHVTGHNRSTVFGRYSMASAVVLPFKLITAARHAMFAPLLIFAGLLLVFFRDSFLLVEWAPALATVLGLPLLVAIGVCLGLGRPRALLYIPEYLVFRVIRSYFALEALLSLVYRPLHPFGGHSEPSAAPGPPADPGGAGGAGRPA